MSDRSCPPTSLDIQVLNEELTLTCDTIAPQTIFFGQRQSLRASTVTFRDYLKLKVRKLSGVTNSTNK